MEGTIETGDSFQACSVHKTLLPELGDPALPDLPGRFLGMFGEDQGVEAAAVEDAADPWLRTHAPEATSA